MIVWELNKRNVGIKKNCGHQKKWALERIGIKIVGIKKNRGHQKELWAIKVLCHLTFASNSKESSVAVAVGADGPVCSRDAALLEAKGLATGLEKAPTIDLLVSFFNCCSSKDFCNTALSLSRVSISFWRMTIALSYLLEWGGNN